MEINISHASRIALGGRRTGSVNYIAKQCLLRSLALADAADCSGTQVIVFGSGLLHYIGLKPHNLIARIFCSAIQGRAEIGDVGASCPPLFTGLMGDILVSGKIDDSNHVLSVIMVPFQACE